MAEDKLIDSLKSWQEKYLFAIAEGIKKYDIVGSGALGKSFKINKQPKVKLFGTTYKMQITALPYWEYINYGRRPSEKDEGIKLYSKIEEWLRLPNVRQKLTSGGKGKYEGGSDKGWTEAKYKSVASAIAHNIHENGFKKKRPFITEAREKIDNDMVKGVADAAAEETEFRISEIINFVNKSK